MYQDTKEEFFQKLFDDMYNKLYIFVSRGYIEDKAFVEDVVQETFMEAYRNLDKLMEHPEPNAWLYVTAKNKMMKLGQKKSTLYPVDDEHLIVKSEEKSYKDVELEETLKHYVSEKDYNMLCDYYLNGYSSTEVAKKYHVSEGGIRMRMTRLKKKLNEELTRDLILLVVCIWGGFYGL